MLEYQITKKQSDQLNTFKFLLTYFVVLIHCCNCIKSLRPVNTNIQVVDLVLSVISTNICSCINAGFFIVSSFLLYRKEFSFRNNIKKKTKSLLIPFILINACVLFIYFIASSLTVTKKMIGIKNIYNYTLVDYLKAFGIGSYAPIYSPSWFLENLFILNLLAKPIKKAIDKFPKFTLFVIIINYLFNPFSFYGLLYPETLLYWCIGYYLLKYKIINNIKNLHMSSLLYILTTIISIAIFLNNIEINGTLGKIIDLFIKLFVLNFFFNIIIFYNSKKELRFVKYYKYSFFIYLSHLIIAKPIFIILEQIINLYSVEGLFVMVVISFGVMVVCINVAKILEKKLPNIYKTLVGQR